MGLFINGRICTSAGLSPQFYDRWIFENILFFVNERRSNQITLMNDNSKNSGNKNVKSNRFLRADGQAQSIKNFEY